MELLQFTILFIFIYFGFKIFIKPIINKSLKAKYNKDYNARIYQQITNKKEYLIPTYPRITIRSNQNEESDDNIIFDSSDFLLINKMFDVYVNYTQIMSIKEKSEIKINDTKYIINLVSFDIKSYYQELDKAYYRKDKNNNLPYNIHIKLIVSPAQKQSQ